MCDFCIPGVGDHDRPYVWRDVAGYQLRFTTAEHRRLVELRENVMDVQHGHLFGPAWGDIASDGGEWKSAAQAS